MNKKMSNFKRWTAVRLMVAILLFSTGPVAEAGMFDWLTGTSNTVVADTSASGYVIAYLSPANGTVSTTTQADSHTLATIQDSYLVQTSTPTKTNRANIINQSTNIKSELTVLATAYSSTPDQTDADPFTTASGTLVHEGTLAANFLPFGTRVKLPNQFGDQIFVVEDRMNARYPDRIDVWFPDRASANQFGLRTVKLQILGL